MEVDRGQRVCHLFWRSDRLKTGFREEVEEVEVGKGQRVCHLSSQLSTEVI